MIGQIPVVAVLNCLLDSLADPFEEVLLHGRFEARHLTTIATTDLDLPECGSVYQYRSCSIASGVPADRARSIRSFHHSKYG
jgi:hypothetical protein